MRFIRLASKTDLDNIKIWLEDEYKKYGEGFFVNVDVIEKYFEKKELFVCIYNNFPAGFITGPFDGPSILNVKKGYKRRGIGKKLFKYFLDEAKKQHINVIKIQCKPESSIKFWETMGFSIKNDNGYYYGQYKI